MKEQAKWKKKSGSIEFKEYLESNDSIHSKTITAYLEDVTEFEHFLAENGPKSLRKDHDFDVHVPTSENFRDKDLKMSSISRKVSSLRAFYRFYYATDM